jgi:hypothetical protein
MRRPGPTDGGLVNGRRERSVVDWALRRACRQRRTASVETDSVRWSIGGFTRSSQQQSSDGRSTSQTPLRVCDGVAFRGGCRTNLTRRKLFVPPSQWPSTTPGRMGCATAFESARRAPVRSDLRRAGHICGPGTTPLVCATASAPSGSLHAARFSGDRVGALIPQCAALRGALDSRHRWRSVPNRRSLLARREPPADQRPSRSSLGGQPAARLASLAHCPRPAGRLLALCCDPRIRDLLDGGETAVADVMRQPERYGEDSAGLADQLRVSFRIDIDRGAEYPCTTGAGHRLVLAMSSGGELGG